MDEYYFCLEIMFFVMGCEDYNMSKYFHAISVAVSLQSRFMKEGKACKAHLIHIILHDYGQNDHQNDFDKYWGNNYLPVLFIGASEQIKKWGLSDK